MKVSLKDDSLPEGTELYVRSLGVLINGQTVDFSAAEVQAFEDQKGMKLAEAFNNDPRVTVGGASAKGGDE